MLQQILDSQKVIVTKIRETVVDLGTTGEYNDIEYLDSLLSKGIYNDVVFDRIRILMDVFMTSVKPLMCRRLYELLIFRQMFSDDVTIKKEDIVNIDDVTKSPYASPIFKKTISVSLSECIRFIEAATPVAFRNKLKETLSSMENIRSMLHFFLLSEESQSDYWNSLFIKETHMYVFNTNADSVKQMITRCNTVKSAYNIQEEIIGLIDGGNMSINNFLNQQFDDKHPMMQFSFMIMHEKDLIRIGNIFEQNGIIIDNIYQEWINTEEVLSQPTKQGEETIYIQKRIEDTPIYISAHTSFVPHEINTEFLHIFDLVYSKK